MLEQEKISKLRRLMELRDDRDEKVNAAEKAKKAYAELEMEIFEELADGPVKSLNNVDLGEPWGKVSFRIRETIYGSVIKGMEEQVKEFFRKTGEEKAMTKPKFHEKRLNEIARDAHEGARELPPGMDWYARRGLTVSRQKG